jgi:hypothetical protein
MVVIHPGPTLNQGNHTWNAELRNAFAGLERDEREKEHESVLGLVDPARVSKELDVV